MTERSPKDLPPETGLRQHVRSVLSRLRDKIRGTGSSPDHRVEVDREKHRSRDVDRF
jgi:hypothetical protein